MRSKLRYLLFIFGLAILLPFEWNCQSDHAPKEPVDAEALFTYEVLPLIETKCLSCHGEKPDEIKGAFDMRTREAFLAGGESGQPPVVPSQPDQSPLYLAVSRVDPDFAMPPKEGNALSGEDIQIFHDWIAAGAPWPDSAQQAEILAESDWSQRSRIPVPTIGGLSVVKAMRSKRK